VYDARSKMRALAAQIAHTFDQGTLGMSSGSETGKKRSIGDIRRAIDQAKGDDDLQAVGAMSPAELDASIRAEGGDPEAIGARGARLAEELLGRRKGLRSQAKAHGDVASALAKMKEAPRTPILPRADLLARIEAARSDARLRTPIAAAFRKRTAEESTDDELRGLLDEIEMLRKRDEA
jgi:hypothetical protein